MDKAMDKDKLKTCIIDLETTSQEPWKGRIILIGLRNCENDETIVFQNESEIKILEEFLTYFVKNGLKKVVGYNLGFDIRFLFGRLMFYKISAQEFFNSEFIDLMWIMRSVKKMFTYNRAGRLDEWSEFLFNQNKVLDSSLIPLYFANGQISEIIEHNLKDLQLTYDLWERTLLVLNNKYPKGIASLADPSGGECAYDGNNPHD